MRIYRLCPKSGERHEAQRDKEGLFVLGAPEHGPRKHLKENKIRVRTEDSINDRDGSRPCRRRQG